MKLIDCGMTEFAQRCQTKEVVCFGAGKQLQEFVNAMPYINIYKIVDNHKYESDVDIQGRKLSIISLSGFIDMYKGRMDEVIMLITCMSFAQVIRQMENISVLQDLECCIFLFIREYTEETIIPPMVQGEALIPKRLHYCWFGKEEIPDAYKRNIESWHKFCPDYEIIRWDESNYDLNSSEYSKQAYEANKWVFVSDYARVDILKQHGGIYLDTDVEVIRSLDELLRWKLFCGFENINWIAWGLAIGAVKEHPILKELLKIYNDIPFQNKDGSYNEITCPTYQTNIMRKFGFSINNRFQQIDGVAVYPKECFAPFGLYRGMGRITTNTYSIHWYSVSWFGERQQAKRNKTEQDIEWVRERYFHD